MTAAPLPNDKPPSSDEPDRSPAPRGRRLWWRFVGLLTLFVAILSADLVWKVNRHVSRMELARIFTMAMSRPRIPQVAPPEPAPPPTPEPDANPSESPPFTMDPTEWIKPNDGSVSQPDASGRWPSTTDSQLADRKRRRAKLKAFKQRMEARAAMVESFQQTEVSEVTRQSWALIGLVLLECVALAGLSAMLNTMRARGNLLIAASLLILGTALTVTAVQVITRWGGFPALALRDYAQIVLRGSGFAVVLLILLMLPQSRQYARELRARVAAGELVPRLAGPVVCGGAFVIAAVATAGAALLGSHLTLPAWHLIRWVLIGWSIPAALAGMLACTGRRGGLVSAYVLGFVGVVVLLACWGSPFVAFGYPEALKVLLALLPIHLIALGRLRDGLTLRRVRAETA